MVGSAVALKLRSLGHAVVLHDEPRPAHARRGMAFTDAFFETTCVLEGMLAKRASGVENLGRMLACATLSVSGVLTYFSDFGVFGFDETYNQHRLNDINETNLKLVCTHCGRCVPFCPHECLELAEARAAAPAEPEAAP